MMFRFRYSSQPAWQVTLIVWMDFEQDSIFSVPGVRLKDMQFGVVKNRRIGKPCVCDAAFDN